ncbi:MAG: MFS transporter, partial [Chloroflexi bacterium]|nr:MFS transporter [Chloroflexota bacterium]
AFCADVGLFYTAVTFISSTTVMPAFIGSLTRSEVIVGLASGLVSAAWLLPQLIVASLVARLPRKKPAILRAIWFTRPIILVLAWVVWRYTTVAPVATLAFTLFSIVFFFAGDAMASIPWFDVIARALPHRRRGTVVGIGQVLGSLGGVAVGFFVRYALGESSPWAYPANFAILFLIGGITFLLGGAALFFVYEPPSSGAAHDAPPLKQVFASLPRIFKEDRPFRQLVLVKVIVGYVGGASAFYVLHATRNLGFNVRDAGTFISAQVIGSMTAGFLLGLVQGKWGPLVHIRLIIALAGLPPALALLATLLAPVAPGALQYIFPAIYFFLGIYMSGLSWPFFNWIMEYAEESRRPLYIGLMNTLTAVVMIAPTLAGWVARSVSYLAVFAGALGIAILSFFLSLTLVSTRRPSHERA